MSPYSFVTKTRFRVPCTDSTSGYLGMVTEFIALESLSEGGCPSEKVGASGAVEGPPLPLIIETSGLSPIPTEPGVGCFERDESEPAERPCLRIAQFGFTLVLLNTATPVYPR